MLALLPPSVTHLRIMVPRGPWAGEALAQLPAHAAMTLTLVGFGEWLGDLPEEQERVMGKLRRRRAARAPGVALRFAWEQVDELGVEQEERVPARCRWFIVRR